MASGRGESSFFLGVCTIVHYVYAIFIFLFGLGCLGVGMWMAIDKDVKAYMVVFKRSPDDELLVAGVACFIVVGLCLIGIGVLGFFGALKRNALFIMLYIAALVGVFIIEVTIGFCVLTFRDQIHIKVKKGMLDQLEEEYRFDNDVGIAWNRIQVRHRCCGADGAWDYMESAWFWAENPGLSDPYGAEVFVPDTCCRLEYNQDRDPTKVDPQNPNPKDRRRCNEDAAGRKNDDNYLHGRGCFAAMLDFIYIHIYLIMGGSITVGLMQIFGIIIAGLLLVAIRGAEPDSLIKKY